MLPEGLSAERVKPSSSFWFFQKKETKIMIPSIRSLFHGFTKDSAGATAIEYALIAAVMAGLIVTAIALLNLEGVFNTIANSLAG